MTRQNRSKLNRLFSEWPPQVIYTCSWLYSQGYGYDLIMHYRKSGWLIQVGNGAVARAGDRISWEGGLYAIQSQLDLPIHVGGKSALLIKGRGHFIPQGKGWPLVLFGSPGAKLPAWFQNYQWEATPQMVTSKLCSDLKKQGLSKHEMGTFSITVASPERAIMEMLSMVPRKENFEEAKLLMEGLATLRPKLVQRLLEACSSIKVKRLFLYLAEECNHPWVQKINLKNISLGKGKRMIEKGGVLNKKYGITIPKSWASKDEEMMS